MEQRFISFCGIFAMLFIAWCFSYDRRKIEWRAVIGGLLLQISLAFLILQTDIGKWFFQFINLRITSLISLSDQGAEFVFGKNFKDHLYAFKVLPTIIFMSSLSYILFYLGIIQKIVQGLAWVMQKVMNISGSESLVTAANIFIGQTEAPLFIKTPT